MLTNEDFFDMMADLEGNEISMKTYTLRAFWKMPSGDPRVLPYLKRLLEDRTPTLLGIPYIFGEVRWMAAQALTSEREAQGIQIPIILKNVVRPLYTGDIVRAAQKAKVHSEKGGVEGLLDLLGKLQPTGRLITYDLALSPNPKVTARYQKEQRVPVLA